MAKVGDKMTAEDIVSNIFVKVLENLSKYQNRGLPFGAWLFTVARNVLFDHYAKSNKSTDLNLYETIEIKDDKEDSSPLHRAKESELKNKVAAVINKLPERELSVVQMKFFSGLTNREIAVALDLSEQNVGIILYRVLRKMKPDLNNLF
jgi:RNA polymerase sigma-70 factor (ECF subfamily)